MAYRKRVSLKWKPENVGNWEGMKRELNDDLAMLERRLARRKMKK